jgi:hypothetical protein
MEGLNFTARNSIPPHACSSPTNGYRQQTLKKSIRNGIEEIGACIVKNSMHIQSIIAAWLLTAGLVSVSHAKEWPTLVTADASYTHARLWKKEPDGIRIVHENGAAKIPIENLSPDQRRHLGLNEQEANEYREEQKQLKAEHELKRQEQKQKHQQALAAKVARPDQDYRVTKVTHVLVLPDGALICNPHSPSAPVGSVQSLVNDMVRPHGCITQPDRRTTIRHCMSCTQCVGDGAGRRHSAWACGESRNRAHDGRTRAWCISE